MTSTSDDQAKIAMSEWPTPWATRCYSCGFRYMTKEFYIAQLEAADYKWICAGCFHTASWDDDNYEEWQEEMEGAFFYALGSMEAV